VNEDGATGDTGVEALDEVHGPQVDDDGATGDTGVEVLDEVQGAHVEKGDEGEDEVETGWTGVLNGRDDECEDHWPQPSSWARAKAKRPTAGMRGRWRCMVLNMCFGGKKRVCYRSRSE
jgi:hypothetical protein